MQYQTYTDGIDTFRDGVRDGNYVVDVAINTKTAADFLGVEGIDWENIEQMS